MINPKAPNEVLLSILAAASIFVCASSSPAQDAVSSKVATLTADNTTTEPKGSSSEALGTGNFWKFPFHVSFSLSTGYDDNVTTSSFQKQGSPFTNANVAISYEFGSPRTKMSLGVGIGGTYYWDKIQSQGTNNYDLNDFLKLSLTHKASPRLTFSTEDYVSYQTQPDFSIAQGVNRRTSNYFYTGDTATVTYLWTPRFSTANSYTLTVLHYDNYSTGFFQDRWENGFGNEFRFLVKPTTSLVAEYRFRLITYEYIDNRDSMNHYVLGGFDHTFNPRLNVSFRGGVQLVEYDNSGSVITNSNQTSPYFQGTLSYNVAKETAVSWTNSYSIEPSDTLANPSRESFRTGLTANHNITARITGTLGAYYENDNYQSANVPGPFSSAFTEDSLDLSLSLRFSVTRSLGIQAGYNYTQIWSDQAFRDYTRNRYWGGLNFAF
jgi:Putative beta-barrel porin 2